MHACRVILKGWAAIFGGIGPAKDSIGVNPVGFLLGGAYLINRVEMVFFCGLFESARAI